MEYGESSETPVRQRSMIARMMGAALLDVSVYEEVEHDTTATTQAAGVVGIVAVCAAIGGVSQGTGGAVASLLAAFLGWLVWSGVTYLIGDKLLGGTATWGELLRTIGFAQAPGVLYALGIIPIIGALAGLVVWVWLLVTVLVAIRQALDFSTGKAVLTAVLGLVAYMVVGMIFASLGGLTGPLG